MTHTTRPARTTRPLALALAAAALPCAAQPDAAASEPLLPPVTVTATLTEQDARGAPATVTVIDAGEITRRNASDLLDAVRSAPGLTLGARQVGGRKTLALRGLEGKHTLTLIDGRRISASDDVVGHSDYQYGWLPMSAVERIEIIRGPMSALYGSEALGGVINLITRTPRKRWEGSLGLSAADPTTAGEGGRSARVSASAGGPVGERLALRVHAEALRSGSVALKEDPRVSETEGRRSVGGGVGGVFDLAPGHALEAGFNVVDEDRFYDALSGPRVYRNTYELDRRHGHLGWRGSVGAAKAQVRAYRSSIDIVNLRSNGVAPTRPQRMTDDVVDGHAAWTLGDHRLTAGGEWRKEALENAGLAGGRDAATHKSVFVQDEWALARALMLTAGVRADRHEYFGNELSPRAYLVWQPDRTWVVKGGFGHAFKAPTLKQISPNYVGAEGPHTFLGNAGIRPESSNSGEIGVDADFGAWSLRATAYQTDVKDLITYRLIDQVGTRRTYLYDNVDRARVRGLEAGFGWQIDRHWHWSTDLTLLNTEDKATGQALPDRPHQAWTTRLQYRAAAGWQALLTLERTGRQTATGGARLPGYSLASASLGQAFKLADARTLHLRAGMENLGNLRLAEESADFGYTERGRRVFVNARLDF
ncbi:TonB-dependent receptor plug domain-containing protein [Piscinibacter sp.]|uniref:TonB-dependent receptor plug domain-containing protein n=1 Tax=Piscinibacter sp. TaxID=1903157 RepID=UPI0039E636F9